MSNALTGCCQILLNCIKHKSESITIPFWFFLTKFLYSKGKTCFSGHNSEYVLLPCLREFSVNFMKRFSFGFW